MVGLTKMGCEASYVAFCGIMNSSRQYSARKTHCLSLESYRTAGKKPLLLLQTTRTCQSWCLRSKQDSQNVRDCYEGANFGG